MSFTMDVKNELCKLDFFSREECISELAAMVRMNGTVSYNNHGVKISFVTENNPLTRRIFAMIKMAYQYEPWIQMSRKNLLRKKPNYRVMMDQRRVTNKFLAQAGIQVGFFGMESMEVPPGLVSGQELKKAFLRGAFLGSGSISNPTSMYHLEMVSATEAFASFLMNEMNEFSLEAKVAQRKGQYVVYIKGGEKVSDFLALVGAHQSLLKLEDVRAMKQVRNNVNRRVNCDTANLNKTINAAVDQSEAIRLLVDHVGWDALDPPLRSLAKLRMDNPDLSLKELGERMDPVLTKSGVNHRMKRILAMAKKYR